MSFTLDTFYRSKEWNDFRKVIIAERTQPDGFIYDEETGKPIVNPYDLILHHKVYLTEENVNDFEISLNPANIEVVSHKTHNLIHERLGATRHEIFIVYGPPLAGKTTWVQENKGQNDLVLDIDSLWQAVTGGQRYVKPAKLRAVVFRLRDSILDMIKFRFGKWSNAYIIGGYAAAGERERLAKELGARLVYIEATEEQCLARLENSDRNPEEWCNYIFEWFDLYGAGDSDTPL